MCFADLRPKPEPALQSVSVPQPVGVPEVGLTPPVAALPVAQPAVALPGVAQPVAVVAVADTAVADPAVGGESETDVEPTWPCTTCQADVPMSHTLCPECGAMFLAGSDEAMSLKVPVVGDLASATSGTRLIVGLVAAIALAAALLIVGFVLGHIF